MAKLNGTSMLLIVSGVTVGATKSFTLDLKSANIDTTSKDSGGWVYRIYGLRDWSVSFDGLFDPAGVFNAEEIYDLINTRDDSLILEMAVIDGTGGGFLLKGNAVCSGLTLTAGMEEAVTYSGTFEANGELDKGTVASS